MKVMIVGCTGSIGQELVKWAPSQWEVLTVDRPQLDITDYPQVSHRDSSFCSNAIINAAYTAVDKVECEPRGHYHFICAPYITLADFFSVVYHKGFIANQAAIDTRHLLNVFQTQSLAARISKTFLSFNPTIGNPHSKESQLMYE